MSKNQLSAERKKLLKAKAHALNPVVIISENGLSDNILKEIEINLIAHELIKIRVFGDDKDLRKQYLDEICEKLNCFAVQIIGKILVIYKENSNKNPKNQKNQKSSTKQKSAKKLKRDYQNE